MHSGLDNSNFLVSAVSTSGQSATALGLAAVDTNCGTQPWYCVDGYRKLASIWRSKGLSIIATSRILVNYESPTTLDMTNTLRKIVRLAKNPWGVCISMCRYSTAHVSDEMWRCRISGGDDGTGVL